RPRVGYAVCKSGHPMAPVTSYAARLQQIAHLQVPEAEAQRLWREIARHRRELLRRLGRDVGRRVALLDFLLNIHPQHVDATIIETEARSVAERFRADVESWFETRPVCGQFLEVTVSGGIATAPFDATSQEQLYALADGALYGVKRRGSNRIETTSGDAHPGTPAAA